MIEDIIKNHRFVLRTNSKQNDERIFYEDESNNIVYVFGPSHFMRYGYKDETQNELFCLDFEGGPSIGLGEEILKDKFVTSIGITFDNGIPIVIANYNIEKKTEVDLEDDVDI